MIQISRNHAWQEQVLPLMVSCMAQDLLDCRPLFLGPRASANQVTQDLCHRQEGRYVGPPITGAGEPVSDETQGLLPLSRDTTDSE